MNATEITCYIKATPSKVYEALIDADAVARWRVPPNMTSVVHEFEPKVGGRYRVSLTYKNRDEKGKTSDHTDTYHGRFIKLEKDSLVTEEMEFETADPLM